MFVDQQEIIFNCSVRTQDVEELPEAMDDRETGPERERERKKDKERERESQGNPC